MWPLTTWLSNPVYMRHVKAIQNSMSSKQSEFTVRGLYAGQQDDSKLMVGTSGPYSYVQMALPLSS